MFIIDTVAGISGGLVLLGYGLIWYHLSGIHKQCRRAADHLESIAISQQMRDAREARATASDRMPTSPLGIS